MATLQQATFWITLIFIVIFVVLILVTLLGSSFQHLTNLSTNVTNQLGTYTTEILAQGTNAGTSAFIMRPRPLGTMVRIWNDTTDVITLYNDNLPGSHTVQIGGGASLGILSAKSTTLCINVNGLSEGTGPAGSWLCTTEQAFST